MTKIKSAHGEKLKISAAGAVRRQGRGTGLTPGVSREGCDGARDSERLLWIVRGQGWEQRARGPWSRREMAIQRRGRGDVDTWRGGQRQARGIEGGLRGG